MTMDKQIHILVHTDDDGSLWAEVSDMPGVFASGSTMDELFEATVEAVTMVMVDGEAGMADVERDGDTFKVSVEGPLRLNEDGRQMLADIETEPAEGEPSGEVVDFRERRSQRVLPAYKVQEVDLLIEA